jgi:hypothetical protein
MGAVVHPTNDPLKITKWIIRDRGRVSSKSGYVRSAPKATELLRRHEMTRWANSGLTRRSKN